MNDTSIPRDHPIAGPGRPDHRIDNWLDALAMWIERRLHETVGWDRGSRLYGITVLDPDLVLADADGGARFRYLADGWVYDLLDSPSAHVATEYDALALCCFGRATNLDTMVRSRCRTVLVADATGQSSVNRLKGAQPEATGPPSGPVAERVGALFGHRHEEERPPPA